ncbi:Homocitrate synthase [Fusarium circinatum]|uniref:Homocitrate synthase n=1 Tax=Fusarium circinatum TaxID=48490 RepID=A0A8H5SSU0_FUSCI|nr:Homocitrate synthase [Fusarium circinatum]
MPRQSSTTDPSTYEILKPEDFGLLRYVHFTSRLTGWNAMKSRVDQLGLKMTDAQVKECTAKLKSMADLKVMTLYEIDALSRRQKKNKGVALYIKVSRFATNHRRPALWPS